MRNSARVNNSIKSRKVFVIDQNDNNLGLMDTRKAIGIAKNAGLDLVEVNSKSKTPVCKVLDYGKWKYDQSKKEKKNKQSKKETKEIKFRPNTSDNDLSYRAKQVDKFLNAGKNVKLLVRFKGREQEHMFDTGRSLLERFLAMLESDYIFEKNPTAEGSSISAILGTRK